MKQETENYLRKAEDCLLDAKILLAQQRSLGAINRAYYTVFDAIQALLFEKNAATKTHQGAHTKFNQLFIQTGIFSIEIGKSVKKVFEKRQVSDYDPDCQFDEKEAAIVVEQASIFLETAKNYLLLHP